MKPFLIVIAVAVLNLCALSTVASSEPLQGTWSGPGYVKPASLVLTEFPR